VAAGLSFGEVQEMSDASSRAHTLGSQVFDEWPAELRALFDGSSIGENIGFTASLLTVDEDGHLRTSLLSAGELYAPDGRTICFALWPSARAARALRERAANGTARTALAFVHDSTFYQVQLKVDVLPDEGELACFEATIDMGEAQRVAYAKLTSGIAFELEGSSRQAVLARWQRQIGRLRLAAQNRRAARDSSGD
jgi:hypothetical protein